MPTTTPNFFQLHGPHLSITYTTTGVDGKPHLAYHDAFRALNFTGDEIRSVATEIGTLVTVTLLRTVDAGSTSFTLLVPTVNLDQTNHAPISTEGITTRHRFSIFPPANQGQTELYTVVPLTGTARLVTF